jgi:CheY-like chemotaxis protein
MVDCTVVKDLPRRVPGDNTEKRVMSAVIAFMDDLMFLSRIRAAAAAQGISVVTARTVPDLLQACGQGARLVVVDLDARLPATEAIAAIRAEPDLAALPIVGFFSHVHAERGADARAAGCTWALPRSAFVRQLEGLLRHPPNFA